jgi:peroxiredoxin
VLRGPKEREEMDNMGSIVQGRIRVIWMRFTQGWWPVAVIALLAGSIVYQRWQFSHPSLPPVLKPGEHLAPITLETPQERAAQLDWSAGSLPTILYVFRPDCEWCARNLEAERAVATGSQGYRFVALSTTKTGLRSYVSTNRLTFPVYAAADSKTVRQLKLVMTPETVLITPEGTVQKVCLGAYVGENRREVEKVFGIKLPEIRSD